MLRNFISYISYRVCIVDIFLYAGIFADCQEKNSGMELDEKPGANTHNDELLDEDSESLFEDVDIDVLEATFKGSGRTSICLDIYKVFSDLYSPDIYKWLLHTECPVHLSF